MHISIEQWNRWHIVAIEGSFLLRNLTELHRELDPIAQTPGAQVLFDLQETDIIDSSGVAFIIRFDAALKVNNGILAICGANDDIRMVLSVLGIEAELESYSDREAFMQRFLNPDYPEV
jgi:anti-anti-sigma factor